MTSLLPMLLGALLMAPPTPKPLQKSGPDAAWRKRHPGGDAPTVSNYQGLIDLQQHGDEPATPEPLDPTRFGAALAEICPRAYRPQAKRYAELALGWARHFGVDPITVAALIYWRSNCRRRFNHNGRLGLGAIDFKMHTRHIRDRHYHYFVRDGADWKPRKLAMPAFGFYPQNLRRSESNIYFTAALLSVAQAQCPDIDTTFGSVRHRHPWSHLFWGDRVMGTDSEDRVAIARRRIVEAYQKTVPKTIRWGTLAIQSPLSGGRRKITSKMGDDRDGGRRRHRGVDFASDRGEPVFAIADGLVAHAGPQLRRGITPNVPSKQARKVAGKKLGRGGLYVMLDHADHRRSAYMHLDRYQVRKGQTVKRGQLIGHVGRSGMSSGNAHLHFELRAADEHVDPLAVLGPLVISPIQTWRGVWVERRQKKDRAARLEKRRKDKLLRKRERKK